MDSPHNRRRDLPARDAARLPTSRSHKKMGRSIRHFAVATRALLSSLARRATRPQARLRPRDADRITRSLRFEAAQQMRRNVEEATHAANGNSRDDRHGVVVGRPRRRHRLAGDGLVSYRRTNRGDLRQAGPRHRAGAGRAVVEARPQRPISGRADVRAVFPAEGAHGKGTDADVARRRPDRRHL
jgi:hypothetical protein